MVDLGHANREEYVLPARFNEEGARWRSHQHLRAEQVQHRRRQHDGEVVGRT